VYADTTQRTDSVNNCKYQNVKVLRGSGSTGQTSTSGTINHGVAEISWGSVGGGSGNIGGVGVDITISSDVTDVSSTKITQFTSSSVTVSSVVGFLVNDWVMIHQTYYPSGNSNTTTVGPFEFKQIQGISGSVVTFTQSIVGTFIDGAQMIYTYRCNDFTLNSGITITTSNWDQSTYNGGIIPIYADGTVTINGTIDVSGKGYQGISSNYNTSTGGFQDGFQGNGYDNAKRGAGAGGLKGAGGSANSGGGGGGGHLNAGNQGLGSGTDSGNVSGGIQFGSAVGTYLTMGGSGGQGGFHDISGAFQRGGHGGGAVYIRGNSVSGSGLINANGTSGFDNVGVRNYQGGAGGGAGGMVLFDVTTSTFTNVTVNYGAGLNGTNGSQQAVTSYRGGDGSLGRIFPTPTPTTSGQQVFASSGTFTVPTGVTSLSCVVVGGGGGSTGCSGASQYSGAGGGGGGLAYGTFPVTAGATVTVQVGVGGTAGTNVNNGTNVAGTGGESRITYGGTIMLRGYGGVGGTYGINTDAVGGGFFCSSQTTLSGGSSGGYGGRGANNNGGGGGGGAGGYGAGGGGNGGVGNGGTGSSGASGGGGGGGGQSLGGVQNNGGGGVGLEGQGSNGSGSSTNNPGGGGSGGTGGGTAGVGGTYGGGAGGCEDDTNRTGSVGGAGGVRIIWGAGRSYPSTNTADV
jgi:hypothetical protein